MTHVSFKIDIEKDMRNIWDKCNKTPSFGNFNMQPNLKKICEGRDFEESKEKLKIHLKRLYDSQYLENFKEIIQKSWDNIEEEFFSRMNNLFGKEYTEDIKSYITTIGICPYSPDEPSFMVSLFYPLQNSVKTCGHEIMHLYFHKFYWDSIEEKIGKKKTGDLKEAITVLLNIEFIDLWLVKDMGYEEHKELRKYISDTWKENKDFEKLLSKCVDFLK